MCNERASQIWESDTREQPRLKEIYLHENLTIFYLVFRREEKQYVEGMEDEDTRRETQNLAYPPGKSTILSVAYLELKADFYPRQP